MLAQLVVGFVVIGPEGALLDGSVHALDLAVGPRMARLGEAMVDVVLGAGEFKGVGVEKAPRREFGFDFVGSETVARGFGEMRAVVGEHGVDFVRDGFDEAAEEIAGDEQLELALFGAHFGDVDMKIADRIGLEFFLGLSPSTLGRREMSWR